MEHPPPSSSSEEVTPGPVVRGMPVWVKVFLGVIAGLVLLFVVLQIATGGRHGPGRHMGSGAHGEATRVAEGAIEIPVTARELAFDPSEITVDAGTEVAIVLTSVDMLHDFTIDELDGHVGAGPGETAKGGFRAEPAGRYTFYCSVPGHREAGMEGILVVRGSSTRGGHRPPAGGHDGR